MVVSIPVITIDGPGGTGKGTISQMLAKQLGWHFLDSGALYRVLALCAKQHHVDLADEESLTVLAAHLDVQFKASDIGDASQIILEGVDVTDEIRTEACGERASLISAIPAVRTALLARQRAFCEAPGLVTDGRDMGTIVFPHAVMKIYLDASREARAQRRYQQLKEKGISVNLAQIFADIDKRDRRDKEREVAPLKPAEDAVIIDTTNLSIHEVLDKIQQQLRERMDSLGVA